MFDICRKNLVVVLCVGALLGACASTSTPMSPKILQYTTPEVQSQLQQSDLLSPLETYWQAHTDRNWKLRYQMEDMKDKVEEKFYVAYYGAAWTIQSAVVKRIDITDSNATVLLEVVYKNNNGPEIETRHTHDKWNYLDGKWVHVVGDPMLTGKW